MCITRRSFGRARTFGCLAVLMCLALAPQARADDKKALAQDLFDRAMALTKQGNFVEACPKFEESQKLDAQIGTLYYLADCQEHTGKLASAWASFTDAADRAESAGKAAHAKEAQGRADKLKVRLTKILLLVPTELLKTSGFQLVRDDLPIGSTLLGVPLPTDPGKHVIKVSATGKRTWETTVDVAGEGATITVAIPALQPEPDVRPVPSGSPVTAPAPPAAPDFWTTQRKVGLAFGVVGVVGVAAGAVLGGLAAGQKGTIAENCHLEGATNHCNALGKSATTDAFAFANGSNVAFALGGVGLAAALGVFLLGGGSTQRGKTNVALVPVVGPASGGLVLEGRY